MAEIRAWVRALIGCAAVVGGYWAVPLRWGELRGGHGFVRLAGALAALLLLTYLVAVQARRALRARRIGERLALLATVVTAVSVTFAARYYTLADQFHGITTRLDAFYFAVTTLTTVGYGDIVATGQTARAVVTVQMAFDLIILASVLTLVLSSARPGDDTPAP
ncbi:voltage-gated potassium channel [Actinomadura rubteroloni]|uniref:Voltage-gated potassium channel n=1 Tax=Actinomadura rubteroloni TaxID=1926885 RepID=A0A2P4UI99_9ACTN|nr:potassium channel family protein [Actinomadura rubteroloni]POM24777.1 voltage-gated potassium channel [Actinomadura rubteroloni]